MNNKRPNIIFLSLDGLRPKNLSCYGYKRNTSPNMDSYAKQGVLFENFFSVSNGTHKSFFSILSGRHLLLQDFMHYPTEKEMHHFFETRGVFLQEILKEYGYKTYFLEKLYGWQKEGFDHYFKKNSIEVSKKWNFIKSFKKISPFIYNFLRFFLHRTYLIPKRLENKIRYNPHGEKITNEAIEIIKQNKENNFFLWLHYDDTHGPYMFPHNFKNNFIPPKGSQKLFETLNSVEGYNKKFIEMNKSLFKYDETIEGIIAKYDTAVLYDDFLIEKIIKTLKQENMLDNTIIFIFADHGVNLFGHGLCLSNSAGVYDSHFGIPLIIFGGKIPKNKRIKALTQSKDIAPTVLDLIGAKYNSEVFDGKSLFPLIFGKDKEIRESIIFEANAAGIKRRAIRTKKYKYMETPEKEYSVCNLCNATHGPITALYDLEKDPDEMVNLADENKKIAEEMKLKLNESLRDLKTVNEKRRIKFIINENELI